MARPRSSDPRQRLSISVPASVLARVTAEATARGESPGKLVGRMVEERFASPEERQAQLDATRSQRSDEQGFNCQHPRDQRQVHSWGARCGACGFRLR